MSHSILPGVILMFQFIAGVDIEGRTVREPIPPASEEEIARLESAINSKLPPDYREFLKKINGGRIDTDEHLGKYACFKVKWSPGQRWGSGDESAILGNLYSLNYEFLKMKLRNTNPPFEIYEALEAFRSADDFRIPEDTISIGDDPGSNQILLGISGDNRGKVFYWFREGEKDPDDPNPPGYDNVGFVANTFNEFLNSIHECSFE